MPTPMLNFRLLPEDVAMLDEIATEDKVSRADVVRALLRAENARRRRRRRATEESPAR